MQAGISALIEKNKRSRVTVKKIVFCCIVLALPLAQFAIFYVGINLNSFRLAFVDADGKFVGFANFAAVLGDWVRLGNYHRALLNSVIVYVLSLVTVTPMALLLSFLVYKNCKKRWSRVVRIIMYAPVILSSVVTTCIYQYFVEVAIPDLITKIFHKNIQGLLSNASTRFWTLFFYGFWLGFGGSIILHCNVLQGIPESITESAKLDGASFFREFIHIAFPYMFGMWKINFVVGIPGLLMSQFNLYEFYGLYAPTDVYTVGYVLFQKTLFSGPKEFPYLSAFGLLITLIILPLSFGVRHLLNKVDPMEN